MAVRTIRIPNSSSTCFKPMCQPPSPITETFSPVLPPLHIGDCINRVKQYTLEGKELFFNDIKTLLNYLCPTRLAITAANSSGLTGLGT